MRESSCLKKSPIFCCSLGFIGTITFNCDKDFWLTPCAVPPLASDLRVCWTFCERKSTARKSLVTFVLSTLKAIVLWLNTYFLLSGVTPIIKGIGAAAVDGAQKASDLQNAYVKTFNLLTTGGEKAAETTKNVAKMQAEGKEMSVQYGVSQQKIADSGYSSSQALGSMKTMLQPV